MTRIGLPSSFCFFFFFSSAFFVFVVNDICHHCVLVLWGVGKRSFVRYVRSFLSTSLQLLPHKPSLPPTRAFYININIDNVNLIYTSFSLLHPECGSESRLALMRYGSALDRKKKKEAGAIQQQQQGERPHSILTSLASTVYLFSESLLFALTESRTPDAKHQIADTYGKKRKEEQGRSEGKHGRVSSVALISDPVRLHNHLRYHDSALPSQLNLKTTLRTHTAP